MKRLVFGCFALIALCLPSVAFCQQDDKLIKKPISPEVLWLAYMKKEPTTKELTHFVLDDDGKESTYRDFAALEILRRGDYDVNTLKPIITERSDSVKRLAWEIFKKRASNEELRALLDSLDTEKRRSGDEQLLAVVYTYLQNAIEEFWTRERSNEDRLNILNNAPYEKDKIRAADELFDHHPTDYHLAHILISSPSRRQRDRVVDIIRLRKDFSKLALRHIVYTMDDEDSYSPIVKGICVERFGDLKFDNDQAVKQVFLDLSDLDVMDMSDLLSLMRDRR